jgi:thiol-disulfide isomerase/thioredoxin
MNDILPEENKPKTLGSRRVWMIGAIGAILGCGLLYGVFQALPNLNSGTDLSSLKVGTMAALEFRADPPPQPVASFNDAQGQPITLAAFRGKVTLVNLWATWCAPCVVEMPTLAKLQTQVANDDFVVVAVSVDRDDTKAEAQTRLAELSDGKLAFFHDSKMAIVFPMKARGFPTTVLYDRNGKELARLAGEADWSSPQAQALIEAALKN